MPNESAAESAKLQSFDLYNFREHFGKALNAIEFPSYLTGYDIRLLIKTILWFLLNMESRLEEILVTEEIYLQFQKIFLSDWDDSSHRIDNVEFEANLQTQLIFQSGNRTGIVNLDPLIKFLINLSEKKQAGAEQLGLSRYVEKSITNIMALPVITVNADGYEVIQNFIVFKQLEEFVSFFTERFYSLFRQSQSQGNDIKNSSYCAILVLLLLLEGKLKNKLITMEICTVLIGRYNSQKPAKYDFLQALSDAKLITIVDETLVLTEEFFNNIQKGEAEIALKFTTNEKCINLAVPIAKLVNATSELKRLALAKKLDGYVTSPPDNAEQFAEINPAIPEKNKVTERAEKPISSTGRMNIRNLLSDESEPTEVEWSTFDMSSPISQWNTGAQDLMDVQEETRIQPVSTSNALSFSITQIMAPTQSESEIEPTVAEPISFSPFSSIEQSSNESLIHQSEEDLNNFFGVFILFARLNECINDFEEMDMISPEEWDKILIALLFIKAHCEAKPVNVQTCCTLLTQYDDELRSDRYISRIERKLITEGIIQNVSGSQKITRKFLEDIMKQQTEISVLIEDVQQKISIEPFINELWKLYPQLKILNDTASDLEQDLNQQFTGAESQTAPLGQTRSSSYKELEYKLIKNAEGNLEVFTLKKYLEEFKEGSPDGESKNTESEIKPKIPLQAQDMTFIVLLFIEGYIRERIVSSQMCNVLLSKKSSFASQKLNILINKGILGEMDDNPQYKQLNSTFLKSLEQDCAEISISVKGNIIKVDLKPLITKLLSLDDELKKLARERGLGLYAISDEPRNFNGIPLNNGEIFLNNVFNQDFEETPSGTDFLDSLRKSYEDSQGESLQGIYSDTREEITENLGKRKQPETIEDIYEELEKLREENTRLKRQRNEEAPAPELQQESETQLNISGFLTSMNSTLGAISTPSQSLIEPNLVKTDTDLDEFIKGLFLP